MEIVKDVTPTETTTYDPNKKYSWTPDDVFQMSGQEFGLVLNAVRAILNTQEAARILLANEAGKAVESVLARNVESGMVKEVEE